MNSKTHKLHYFWGRHFVRCSPGLAIHSFLNLTLINRGCGRITS